MDWARAYAKQGKSDLAVYDALKKLRTDGTLAADCHELHYFQMALEKIGKAYVLRFANAQIQNHRSSHDVAKAFMQNVQKDPAFKSILGTNQSLSKEVRSLATALEQLAPAVERESNPRNCEYPWSDGSMITVPVDVGFRATWTFSFNAELTLRSLLQDVAEKCVK
ncbi:MAG TPA: hypothetical protein VIV60_31360 [Polyangiaceae bacterium]